MKPPLLKLNIAPDAIPSYTIARRLWSISCWESVACGRRNPGNLMN